MARYRFCTRWLIGAPPQACWDALADVQRWPEWWQGVEAVQQLAPGDGRRVGSVHRVRWRARLPYAVEMDFTVEHVDEPAAMRGRSSGALEGTGAWRLFEDGGLTAVLYEWDVRTTHAWMNVLAPVARPLFVHNHDWLMRRGGEGLARRLGATLRA